MRVRLYRDWTPGHPRATDYGNRGAALVVEMFGRWVRLALYVGSPPGSHIGLWRTRMGDLRGLNLRIGRRYVGPCLTAFVHTRRSR